MIRLFKDKKGFTLTEVLFVAVIMVLVVTSVLSAWIFTYGRWATEREMSALRVDIIKAQETIKKDLKLSSLTYISFYPEGSATFTAISMPVAELDANGFFDLDSSDDIDWDKTVIYHLYIDGGGNKSVRRTVYDPRDNDLDDEERYTQLEDVATSGTGGAGSTTDTDFLKNVENFEVSPFSGEVDFYEDSTTAVKVGKIIFGWAKLAPGDHTVRFTVTGKNDSSSGYNIGLDNISIEPSGSVREAEYYDSSFASAGMLSVSLGTVNRIYGTGWDNNNYLEFDTNQVNSYMEFEDYYDLWRESSFDDASLDNVEKFDEEVHVRLETPDDDEDGDFTWTSLGETGDSQVDGLDGSLPVSPPVSIRTVVTSENTALDGDFVRVSFRASEDYDLMIDKAYITKRREGTTGADGLENDSPSGEPEDYHFHQQLFFEEESSGDITDGITVPAGSVVWSVWTAFPFDADSDYLISYSITDTTATDYKYWEPTIAGTTRTYFVSGSYTTAGTPDWPSSSDGTSENIYAVSGIDVRKTLGTVESRIFDTGTSSPVYNEIKWSEDTPTGTDVILKDRSSSDKDMTGATAWDAISGSGTNPHSASSGSSRYVQFMAELSAVPYWETGASTLSYSSYITSHLSGNVYDFPKSGGDPYITAIDYPRIDDVEIDWPGTERICAITGYIARKDDYGQAKVTVDGDDLLKILSIHIKLSKEIDDKVAVQESTLEVEPANTGK